MFGQVGELDSNLHPIDSAWLEILDEPFRTAPDTLILDAQLSDIDTLIDHFILTIETKSIERVSTIELLKSKYTPNSKTGDPFIESNRLKIIILKNRLNEVKLNEENVVRIKVLDIQTPWIANGAAIVNGQDRVNKPYISYGKDRIKDDANYYIFLKDESN